MVRVSLNDARDLICRALTREGVATDVAMSVASALVAAEAEGQAGHGFSRLEDYCAQVRSGKIVADARPRLERLAPASLRVDAGHGFAFPALDLARGAVAEAARAQGTASVGIARSHHCGALSYQVGQLAASGLIAIMVANTPKAIAPFGGGQPVFGTNPIAFAAPRKGSPLIIDLSLSVVARGKVMAALKAGRAIPEGWALDASGASTTEPGAALGGSMVAIGGPKGAALAMMVEVLAAAATGAAFSYEASSFFDVDGEPPGVGQMLIAISPRDASGFVERVEQLVAEVTSDPGTRLPGARRVACLEAAEADGIDVPFHLYSLAQALAGR